MYALYARQSVEKEDSISVESQLEYFSFLGNFHESL